MQLGNADDYYNKVMYKVSIWVTGAQLIVTRILLFNKELPGTHVFPVGGNGTAVGNQGKDKVAVAKDGNSTLVFPA